MNSEKLDNISRKGLSNMFIAMSKNCNTLGEAIRKGVTFENPRWSYELDVKHEKKYQLVLELKEVEKMNRKEIDPDKFEPYKKLPVIVGAFQTDEEIEIETLKGTMKANPGDYIIKGIEGEISLCKQDIFEKTHKKIYPDKEV